MLCEAEYDVDEINAEGDKKNQNCIFKHNYNANNLSYQTYVNENIFHDKTLPRINLKCVNEECPSNTEGNHERLFTLSIIKKIYSMSMPVVTVRKYGPIHPYNLKN